MRKRFQLMALGLGLAFAMAVATPAEAGFNASVATSVTQESGGIYLYSYILINSATSTLGISEFDMDIPGGANLQSLMAPTGFLSLYTPGDVTISFDSGSAATDIAPGMTGTFSFTSMYAPGLGQYTLLTYDDVGFDPNADTISGFSIAPLVVPEPGSLILLGLGLPCAVVAIPAVRRRRLKASQTASA